MTRSWRSGVKSVGLVLGLRAAAGYNPLRNASNRSK